MFDEETMPDEKHRQYKELQKCERANNHIWQFTIVINVYLIFGLIFMAPSIHAVVFSYGSNRESNILASK